MKKILKYSFLILLAVLYHVILVQVEKVYAQSSGHTANSIEEFSGSTPYIAFGEKINFTKNNVGDVFLAGNEVTISNEIEGDAIIVGDKVIINAPITGSAKVISSKVEIRARIGGSFSFIAENVFISAAGEIDKDVYGSAVKFNHDGRIGRNLNLYASQDAQINIGGKVIGDYIHSSINSKVQDKGFIGGKTNYYKYDQITKADERKSIVIFQLMYSALLITLGIIGQKFLPKIFAAVYRRFSNPTLKSIWGTVLLMLFLPVILIAFIITIIGVPIAIAIIFTFILIALCSPIFSGLWIGQKIIKSDNISISALIIGVLIYNIISLIQPIGIVLTLISFILVTGAISRIILQFRKI